MTGDSPAAPADEHATPLTDEEERALIPTYVTTRGELNLLEQRAILTARRNALQRALATDVLLSEDYLLRLHKNMYGDIWKWAGTIRTTERSIGVPAWEIRPRLRDLLDDVTAWLEHDAHPPDEIAVRLHHRLVAIHPFVNGNGRHARLTADVLAKVLGRPVFTWGAGDLATLGDVRQRYVDALRQADLGDCTALVGFARA